MTFRPNFISFDCYGTLINFEMGPTAQGLFSDRVDEAKMPAFLASFKAYRLDEVLGAWKPFLDVVVNSIVRTCTKHGIDYRDSDGQALYDAVPTWQPHPNVVEVLEAIAPHYPLVILSNSMVDLIPASVEHLKAPFHAVYTAEEAQAYKPRMQAFEYMFDRLGCGARADDALLVELPLRPDDGGRSRLHGEGVHRSRTRTQLDGIWRKPLERHPPATRPARPVSDRRAPSGQDHDVERSRCRVERRSILHRSARFHGRTGRGIRVAHLRHRGHGRASDERARREFPPQGGRRRILSAQDQQPFGGGRDRRPADRLPRPYRARRPGLSCAAGVAHHRRNERRSYGAAERRSDAPCVC